MMKPNHRQNCSSLMMVMLTSQGCLQIHGHGGKNQHQGAPQATEVFEKQSLSMSMSMMKLAH